MSSPVWQSGGLTGEMWRWRLERSSVENHHLKHPAGIPGTTHAGYTWCLNITCYKTTILKITLVISCHLGDKNLTELSLIIPTPLCLWRALYSTYWLAQFVWTNFFQLRILHWKHDEDDGAFVIIRSSSQTLLHHGPLQANQVKNILKIRLVSHKTRKTKLVSMSYLSGRMI